MTFADLAAAATKNKEFAKERKDNEAAGNEEGGDEEDDVVDVEAAPDVHYTPIVKLEVVEQKTLEEGEIEFLKMRAKIFRFDKEANEWKERGTGDVRILQDCNNGRVRLVMRRDQTLKVCANHLLTNDIILRANVGSDRSWVYNVMADISDGEPKPELFAIRFANSENANQFKQKFEEAQKKHGVKPTDHVARGEGEKADEVEKTKAKEEGDEQVKPESEAKGEDKSDEAIKEVEKSLESVKIKEGNEGSKEPNEEMGKKD